MTIEDEINKLKEEFCGNSPEFRAKFDKGIKVKSYGLVDLFVPKPFRGKGLAKIFLNKFTSILDKHEYGAATVASEVHGGILEKLIKLYEGCGFVKVGDKERRDLKHHREWPMERKAIRRD